MPQERNGRRRDPDGAAALGLRPLRARSVVASVLLGTHPPQLPAAALVRLGRSCGIAPGTIRVALSRMVAAGELAAVPGGYRLVGEALLGRQRVQDEALHPPTGRWDGNWRLAVVVSGSRTATDRADQRRAFTAARFAEWREGVWLRPANLPPPEGPVLAGDPIHWLRARPEDDPVTLANELWDLGGWAARARELLGATGADAFTTAAALLRHLRTDPLLPPPLLPAGWPADELRRRYASHVATVQALIAERATEG